MAGKGLEGAPLHYVYLAIAGESQQGGPGCAFVDTCEGRAYYTRTEAIQPLAFREHLSRMQEEHADDVFVVTKVSDNMHVFRCNRRLAEREVCRSSLQSSLSSEPGSGADSVLESDAREEA